MAPLLELRHVTKSYPGGWRLDDVSFSVERHTTVCLLGPSGCGKSTLLRLIAGLERVEGGQIILNGEDVTDLPPRRRAFGLMFQEYALFPHKDVFGNVAFGLRMHGYRGDELRKRVADVLRLVKLSGFEGRNINQLSGGERQRVALARSLAPQPALLMLDEPLGSLDRAMREHLMEELPHILHRAHMTTISVTHDQEEAFAIGDLLVVLREGRAVQVGTPNTVYHRPASTWVAKFLDLRNLVTVYRVGDGWADTPLGRLAVPRSETGQLPSSADVKLLIRPDASRVEDAEETVSPSGEMEGSRIQGIVMDSSFRGEYFRVGVRHDSGVELTFNFPGSAAQPRVGEGVVLLLRDEALTLVQVDGPVCSAQAE